LDEKTKEIVERLTRLIGEDRDYDEDTEAMIASRDLIESLSERVGELEREAQTARPVVAAACGVVEADTYKHPMLSRADAVQAGVMALHDAVNKWWASRPPCQQGEGS